MHASVLGFFVTALRADEVQGKKVLEVGSADFNGSVRPIIQQLRPASYLGTDASEGMYVDMVVDCENLVATLGENCADVVISAEMLEHVKNWKACLENIFKAVKPGGIVVLTTRSIPFPYHSHPYDFWRYAPESMMQILDRVGFEKLLVATDPDDTMPGVLVKARKPFGWKWPGAKTFDGVTGVTPMTKPITLLALPVAPDGSGYYRMYLPFKYLGQGSEHTVYIPAPGKQLPMPTADDLQEVDVLIMQRPVGPRGTAVWREWKQSCRLVYECDDDILRVEPAGLPHLYREDARRSIRECLRISDLVTVSTEPLAAQFRPYNDNVIVLPNYINGELLDLRRPRRENLTVGWAGGSSHLIDWATAQDAVRDAIADHPEVDLHFVGHDWSPLLGRRARFSPWEPSVWDYYKKIDFDIGLAPLANDEFNECKSYIRCLEYGALGIPVIASDVAPYREYVKEGETGFLVKTPEQWRHRLHMLINDHALREQMGKNAKVQAADYTIQEHWHEWIDAYTGLVKQ